MPRQASQPVRQHQVVRIVEGEQGAARLLDARLPCPSDPRIACQAHDAQGLGPSREHVGRGVGRRVVDDDHLEGRAIALRPHRVEDGGEQVGAIEGRDDDRDPGRVAHRTYPSARRRRSSSASGPGAAGSGATPLGVARTPEDPGARRLLGRDDDVEPAVRRACRSRWGGTPRADPSRIPPAASARSRRATAWARAAPWPARSCSRHRAGRRMRAMPPRRRGRGARCHASPASHPGVRKVEAGTSSFSGEHTSAGAPPRRQYSVRSSTARFGGPVSRREEPALERSEPPFEPLAQRGDGVGRRRERSPRAAVEREALQQALAARAHRSRQVHAQHLPAATDPAVVLPGVERCGLRASGAGRAVRAELRPPVDVRARRQGNVKV